MSSGTPLNSARRTISFAVAAIVDADGIKTSFATSTSPVTLGPSDLNGATVSSTTGALLPLPRTLTITRSNNANQFGTGAIVVTGRRGGETISESFTPANNDGNDTLAGSKAFDSIASIAIPAQDGTGGTFTIGVRDICAPVGDRFASAQLHSDGDLVVAYAPNGTVTDTIPALADHVYPVAPYRVLTASMADGVTVGLS